MKIYAKDIRRMIDVSLLNPDVTIDEVMKFIDIERKERFIGAFVMPCNIPLLIKEFKDEDDILVGGVIGFPTGADTTENKLIQTKERLKSGVDELDMVINIGWLKSGKYEEVLSELKQVISIAEGKPIKVILEVTLLTDEEIKKGCELVMEAGADYVKTGTGSRTKPTTLHHIDLMNKTTGGKIGMKAAGGVRDLDTVIEMIKRGVTRFGIGVSSALSIIKEAEKYPNGIEL